MMGEESARRTGASGTPPWQRDQEAGESFGSWLKKHREGVDIRLEQVAEHTKISRDILQAIEEERSEDLPASVFVRGFLRQYARFVGLDPDEVVSLYSGAHPSMDEFSPSGKQPRESGGTWLGIALVVLLAAVAAGWWFFGRSVLRPDSIQSADNAVATMAEVSDPASSAAREEGGTSDEPAALAIPDGSAPEIEESTAGAATDQSAAGQEFTVDGLIRVTIDFVEDCWVESTVDGERQISTLYAKGESLRLEAEESVHVLLGNYSGAVVHVNGHAYSWPPGIEGDRTELNVDTAFVASLTGLGDVTQSVETGGTDGEASDT